MILNYIVAISEYAPLNLFFANLAIQLLQRGQRGLNAQKWLDQLVLDFYHPTTNQEQPFMGAQEIIGQNANDAQDQVDAGGQKYKEDQCNDKRGYDHPHQGYIRPYTGLIGRCLDDGQDRQRQQDERKDSYRDGDLP